MCGVAASIYFLQKKERKPVEYKLTDDEANFSYKKRKTQKEKYFERLEQKIFEEYLNTLKGA